MTRHDKSQSTGIIPFQPSVFSTETIPFHFSAETALQVSNTNAISTSVRRDALQKGDLLKKPIWEDIPEELIDVRKAFSHRLLAQSKWSFWHTWYETMWNGTFEDWDLVFEVIKIPDNVWQGNDGAEKIANEITRIKATLKLKAEIASLKEKLQAQEDIATAGHNQGPALDDTVEVHKTVEMIWPVLDDIEAEANKEAPSPDRLKILGQKLLDISVIITKYCGGLTNIALEKSAETIGEAGTKLAMASVAATYVGTNEGIQSVAKAAWDLAKALAGG